MASEPKITVHVLQCHNPRWDPNAEEPVDEYMYIVEKVTNSTTPVVKERLSRSQVDDLIRRDVTVHIKV